MHSVQVTKAYRKRLYFEKRFKLAYSTSFRVLETRQSIFLETLLNGPLLRYPKSSRHSRGESY